MREAGIKKLTDLQDETIICQVSVQAPAHQHACTEKMWRVTCDRNDRRRMGVLAKARDRQGRRAWAARLCSEWLWLTLAAVRGNC